MASARTWHLLVCDGSGRCTGLVTHAQLAAVRDGSAYSDRVRLRDILGDRGPFTSPVTTMAEAGHMMRYNPVDALLVVDEHGSALGTFPVRSCPPRPVAASGRAPNGPGQHTPPLFRLRTAYAAWVSSARPNSRAQPVGN